MTSGSRFFKHALAMRALCVGVIGAWARPAAADGTEPQTQPNDLPPIRWIVVERNGQKAVATNVARCETRRPADAPRSTGDQRRRTLSAGPTRKFSPSAPAAPA
jgi:hypothetical protein